jgi:hypothetical protein
MRATYRLLLFTLCIGALAGSVHWPFVMDDAYIGYTYIKNLYDHGEFVFFPGERVEGVTNAGWLLLQSLLRPFVSEVASGKLLGAAMVCATLFGMSRLSRQLRRPEGGVIVGVAMILLLTSFDYIYFALSGMETACVSALLAVSLHHVARGRHWVMAVAMGGAYSVRPETVLIVPLWVAGMSAGRSLSGRKALAVIMLFASIIALITAARYVYYSALMPNTFSAKPTSLSELLLKIAVLPNEIVEISNISKPFNSVIGVLVVVAGVAWFAVSLDKASFWFITATIGAGFAFSVYAGEDWTGRGRYFAPYLPLVLLTFAAGLWGLL